MFCLSFPEEKVGIMFIPYGFEAKDVSYFKKKRKDKCNSFFVIYVFKIMKFIIGFDLAGLLLGWRFFDHAGNLN
jgi:hypothetical protein